MLDGFGKYSIEGILHYLPVDTPAWYVACTMPRHEKKVALHLENREVEPYLPLYSTVHRWKDRRMHLQLPLFPGYVFVRMRLADRMRVVSIPGIHRLVCFNGPPVQIPDLEMQNLRAALEQVQAEPHPYLKIGEKVRIRYGPFQGHEAVLVRKKDKMRVVLSVDLLLQAISIEVDVADIQRLN